MCNDRKIEAFYAQANYYLRAAHLATSHRAEQKDNGNATWNNFEAVIVGTNHSFAAEILLKGISLAKSGDYCRIHSLKKLMKHSGAGNLYQKIKMEFQKGTDIPETLVNQNFDELLSTHSDMFEKMRYACEDVPPPLDMDFTSYLCKRLAAELNRHIKTPTSDCK